VGIKQIEETLDFCYKIDEKGALSDGEKKWDATALRALPQALDVPKYDRKQLSPPRQILC
jgi:hypothetical protein